MSKILFIDTETGGLNEDVHSLLSVALGVYENGRILDKMELFVKDSDYTVSARALEVNNINIIEHDKIAEEKAVVVERIIGFILKHFPEGKAIVAGHNVSFDIKFLAKLFKETDRVFHNYISHRSIDTCSILRFLYEAGVLKEDIAASDKAFAHFGITIDGRHTALGDCIGTMILFLKLINLVNIQLA